MAVGMGTAAGKRDTSGDRYIFHGRSVRPLRVLVCVVLDLLNATSCRFIQQTDYRQVDAAKANEYTWIPFLLELYNTVKSIYQYMALSRSDRMS